MKKALIVIDMQNDFIDGSLGTAEALSIVENVKDKIRSYPPECVDELVMTQDLDSVLPKADVIMSVLPNTAATRYIYTAESFDHMKNSAIFINCGRGNAVSSEVLAQALLEGKISAAAMDVAAVFCLTPFAGEAGEM